MSRRIMLVPVGFGVGLTSIAMGLERVLEQQGVPSCRFKPIAQKHRFGSVAAAGQQQDASYGLPIAYVEQKISSGEYDSVLEDLVGRFEKEVGRERLVVIEGMAPTERESYSERLNRDIARALGADIVLVATPDHDTPEAFEDRIEIAARNYGGVGHQRVVGCIINKLNAPDREKYGVLVKAIDADLEPWLSMPLFKSSGFRLLGHVPWHVDLIAPRVRDVIHGLEARIINAGSLDRRIRSVGYCAGGVAMVTNHLVASRLVVVSGDREDIIVTICLAALNGTKIGALLLTGGITPSQSVLELCQQAFATGLPVLSVQSETWQTARIMMNFDLDVSNGDLRRMDKIKEYVAGCLESNWVDSLKQNQPKSLALSPPAFRYQMSELARSANKLVVLPEGTEPRTVKAAALSAMRGIARCLLLGKEEEVRLVAQQQGVVLGDNIIITDPDDIRDNYIDAMMKLRAHKGLTELMAAEQLKDPVVLATMMLAEGHVDGLVSGAVTTTANTIRPALQLIKTAPNSSLVSSIFFMLMPDQVLVYGDCAINPDPTAEELADIAIQSADSARQFGIDPRVAMISYSTGSSAAGDKIEKVAKATALAQAKRPDLIIDGPLQYDAASVESVARSKAPGSPLAGNATVFIFPDLNTGNTTYKAVQRSADLISIGPVLQGMNKPVNDLSRGSSVDDIIYTIMATVIQARDET